jgi:hypothetical protein
VKTCCVCRRKREPEQLDGHRCKNRRGCQNYAIAHMGSAPVPKYIAEMHAARIGDTA